MIATYFIMKLAMQAVLQECNDMAATAQLSEQASLLKSRVAQLELDYASGAIDSATYERRASEILEDMKTVAGSGLQVDDV